MLSQQVTKRLFGQDLKIDTPVTRQKRKSLQGLDVELDALARHGTRSKDLVTRDCFRTLPKASLEWWRVS
jgi:hypothetical protein